MDENPGDPVDTAGKVASGVARLAPGDQSVMEIIPATSIGTGGEEAEPDFNAWDLVSSGGLEDTASYLGDLIVQGISMEDEWEGASGLSQGVSGRGFGTDTPDFDSFEEARLESRPDPGTAASSSTIRLMSESLAPQSHKYFWEQDPFLQTVFGNKSTADMILGSVQQKRPLEGVIDVDSIVEETPIMKQLRRRPVKPIPLHARALKHVASADEATKRTSLISDWATLVAIDVHSFAIGAMLRAEGISRGGILDAVSSCLAAKATSTLQKRYCAMKRFVQWAMQSGRQIFPVEEHVAYSYVVSLREEPTSSASSGQSFFEALHFTASLLGMKHNLAEVGDQRIKGVAEELARSGIAMQQAVALTVDQVKKLEALACLAEDLADTLTLGSMLIMMYGCARHSDLARAKTLIWDYDADEMDKNAMEPVGYIELQVLGHKTARSVKMKRTYMPVVAPMLSLSGHPWFLAWAQARKAFDLEFEGEVKTPLLCRFNESGQPMAREVTSAETGRLLRAALGVVETKPNLVRSHSLKVTTLSWAAKGGMDLPSRRILGHHLDPGAKAAEIYGRDSISAALRKMCKLLALIKQGRFCPDSSRSGRFRNMGEAPEREREGADSNLDSDELESISSMSEESTDLEAVEGGDYGNMRVVNHAAFMDLRPCHEDVPIGFFTWRHKVSGVQHLRSESDAKFQCGRRVTDRYIEMDQPPLTEIALCQGCLKTRVVHQAQQQQEVGADSSHANL